MSLPLPSGIRVQMVRRRLAPIAEDVYPESLLAVVRCSLLDELDAWALSCGYNRGNTEENLTPSDMFLFATMYPRTDGEWPAIHAAVHEDGLDRQRLAAGGGDPF